MTMSTTKEKTLIWVYPPHKWVTDCKQTFVYGWVKPDSELFIKCNRLEKSVKTFPNGNFAQVVKLPYKENILQLVQVTNKNKRTISRKIIVNNKKLERENTQFIKEQEKRTPQKKLNSFTIVIDPGHGGKEHGTHSPKGTPEKYFNLQIAQLLYKKLSENFKVYLTRNKDKFISLKRRVEFAKKQQCDLLISIHHNALPDNKNPLHHKGVGIYYTHSFVKGFAKQLLESISREAKLNKYGVFKRDFILTKPDFCCATLIECGFLIHPEEAEYITRKITQEKIVSGIVKSINLFVNSAKPLQ